MMQKQKKEIECTMAGTVQLNFGTIIHPEFGLIYENLTGEIKLLRTKPIAIPGTEAGAGKDKVDPAYLADLYSRLMEKCHGCFPNDLDEDIAVKLQNCIDQALSVYSPGLDSLGTLELLAVRYLLEVVGHENASPDVMPELDESDDDEDGEEDEAHIVLYTIANKFLLMLREVLEGNGDLEEFVTSLPNFHTSDISKDTVIVTMVGELMTRPEWQKTTPAQREPCITAYMANAQASYVCHYDYFVHNRFTADTYHAFFESDGSGALFCIEMRAIFGGVFLHPEMRYDILFQRLRATLATCSRLLYSFYYLVFDCTRNLTMHNPLLIEMTHLGKKCAEEGKSAEEIRAELCKLLKSRLDKCRLLLADVQLMVNLMPSVFAKDDAMVKYLQLLVTAWNGQVEFYDRQQQKNS